MSNKLGLFLKDATRIVVIGMGNELRADDAVGLYVVRHLKPFVNERLKVFEGYMTPEAFIAPACTTKPSHVLIVDAAELGEQPGVWRLLSRNQIKNGLFTTHAIPASEVALEIERRCSAKVRFLGIQPKIRDVSLSLSSECTKTVHEITKAIRRIIEK